MNREARSWLLRFFFWYDEEGKNKKKRRRTNGVAMTTDGLLIYAESICSRKDQFVKAKGRMIVEQRIIGRAQRHCLMLHVDDLEFDPDNTAEAAAATYRTQFPEDEVGSKRAYNVGRIFDAYKAEIERRASEVDEF